MAWFRSNWRWATLNLLGVSVVVVVLSLGSTDSSPTYTFDPMLESGKWAIRFLLVCLSMTPLNRYFGWNSAIKLRKPAGLWAFGFAVLHVLTYMRNVKFTWLQFPMPSFIVLGMLGLLILTALAVTSNRWAMRRLRKNWKRLHRLVYLAGNLVAFHAILATAVSKKIGARDPQAIHELKVYLALLVVLLVVRIPLVRRALGQLPVLLRRQRQADEPVVVPITTPDGRPEYWPRAYGREANFYLEDVYAEIQPEEEIESQRVIA
jgi:sulfoxide reductase heme-binding subunit YedZ